MATVVYSDFPRPTDRNGSLVSSTTLNGRSYVEGLRLAALQSQ